MSYRSVKFAPALLASIVAGTNLATVTDLRARSAEQVAEAGTRANQAAADNCLSAPKGATPSGSHWYYRIDRTTKRQCWYLREENEKADDKFARAAPPQSAPAGSSAEVPQQTETRKSFDDARAEWVAQQNRAEPNPPAKAESRTAGAGPASADQNGPRATMPNVLAPAPLATMRWNDAPAASASTNPANLQVAAAATPANQPPQADEVQQPAADQVAPLAAEPAAVKPTASLQKLLLVMAAALALAGLTVSAIVRIGRMRARRAMRRKRRAMWDAARTKRPAPPVFHDEDARLRRTGAVQHTRVPKERPRVPQERARVPQERVRVPQERVRVPQEQVRAPQERAHVPQERERDQQVTEMLARLARSAQT
ncbi:hypothetical protein V1277_006975 [Bradyrhizobium sp. AZCC 1588]|uniref:hypothetical protein n=1 Tax=unclassified Bradyrhizobium TaxID=2631580 RepID=UPI002FF157BB